MEENRQDLQTQVRRYSRIFRMLTVEIMFRLTEDGHGFICGVSICDYASSECCSSFAVCDGNEILSASRFSVVAS
ncbi:Hypothetical predicted protein [Octopus vulgaris]|uniref:Uncharacterized protein n=1 Tax=Octopus vulgaris TaxID=6645 RepID=A0AA36FGH0_OCTVU|nr:Hypothetical predicted protein [Octopus vulgaris]